MTAPRPVTMGDLTDGLRVRHVPWDETGEIRITSGSAEFRPDDHHGDLEVHPEGPVFPSDLEILAPDRKGQS